MSVEPMVMVTMSGPEKMVDTAIQNLVINREFHSESAIKLLSGAKELVPFASSNPYSEPLSKSLEIAKALDLTPDYNEYDKSEFEIKETDNYLTELSSRLSMLRTEKDEKNLQISNNQLVCEQLSHFAIFNVELRDLFTMKYLKFHYGRLPVETYKDCLNIIDNRPDVFFFTSGQDHRWVYGAFFALPAAYGKIEAIFSSMGFERIRIDVEGDVENPANEVIARLQKESCDAEERIKQLEAEYASIKQSESEKVLRMYSWLRFESESFDALSLAGHRHGKFYIIGWIPKKISEDYVTECEAFSGFACFLTEPKEVRETPPPVKFKKGILSEIYQPFLEMYGLPATGELDPRLFMAITYTIIFGVMFGDVGQGLVLSVVGFLVWKLKGSWLGRIIGLCGISSVCFGLIYGSVFGSEELLPWGFKVLENGNTMQILLVSVVLGVVLITICMIMNMITGIRQRDIQKIFFSPNGVAGFVFYVGLAVAVAFMAVLDKNIFTLPYIICVIVLPLLSIFLGTPLSKLITGKKDWKPESLGMFFVEGFFEMFETLLSYISNTISFLRIGAYAISHAGMMLVVYLLSGGTSIPGIVFGNILVAGLETVLVCIQVMRLEYYEMFGRFYQGGGVKFSPKVIDYKIAE